MIEIRDGFSIHPRSLREDAMSLCSDVMDAKKNSITKPKLVASIDATHSGRLTNLRVYPGAVMKKSALTFLKPYAKPVLINHNDHGDAIGRVSGVEYIQLKQGDAFTSDYKNPSTGTGSGFLRLALDIVDPVAIEKFVDGRYATFSTRQHFTQAFCSVCGEDIAEAMGWYGDGHEHRPGRHYKANGKKTGKDYLCYIITGPMEYKEVSCVNIPGDDEVRVHELNFVEPEKAEDRGYSILNCFSDGMHSLDSLGLSVGSEQVDLLAGASVTARDRELLTGKVIVAVSPDFKPIAIEDMEEPKEQTKEKDVDVTLASGDKNVEDVTSKEVKDQKQEGVVAPDVVSEPSDSGKPKSGITEDALIASIEAMTADLNAKKGALTELDSKVSRLEATIAQKDAELLEAKQATVDSLAEAKTSLATQLVQARLFLRKADISKVSTREDFDTLVTEYAERTIESLKDSISDLAVEVVEFSKKNGTPVKDALANPRLENPVAKKPATVKDNLKKPSSKEALETFINN